MRRFIAICEVFMVILCDHTITQKMVTDVLYITLNGSPQFRCELNNYSLYSGDTESVAEETKLVSLMPFIMSKLTFTVFWKNGRV